MSENSIAKHTPEPWSRSVFDDGISVAGGISIEAIDEADGQLFELCAVFGVNNHQEVDPTSEANARLICAAPELLAALEEAILVIERIKPEENGMGTLVRGRAAIAKATGAHP